MGAAAGSSAHDALPYSLWLIRSMLNTSSTPTNQVLLHVHPSSPLLPMLIKNMIRPLIRVPRSNLETMMAMAAGRLMFLINMGRSGITA